MSNSRSISQKTIKRLYALSRNQCAMDNCTSELFQNDGDCNNSDIAHIQGLNPGSPRYNPNQSNKERNNFDNLILLCPSHHREIDNKSNLEKYTVEYLKEMKYRHEYLNEQSASERKLCLHHSLTSKTIAPEIIDILHNKILEFFEYEIESTNISQSIQNLLELDIEIRIVMLEVLKWCQDTRIDFTHILGKSINKLNPLITYLEILDTLNYISEEKYFGDSNSYISIDDNTVINVEKNYTFKLYNGVWSLDTNSYPIQIIYQILNESDFYSFLIDRNLESLNSIK